MSKKPYVKNNDRRTAILNQWEPRLAEIRTNNPSLADRVKATLYAMPLAELEAIEAEANKPEMELLGPVTLEEMEQATAIYEREREAGQL